MIVICTHKNPQILRRLLTSIRKFSVEDHKILVVETSDSEESKSVAEEFKCYFFNSTVRLWEIGAYIVGLQRFKDEDEYFMFQDSLEIVAFDWEKMFRIPSCGHKVVALKKIELWNDPGQHQYLLDVGIGNGYYTFNSLFDDNWDQYGYGCMYTVNYMPNSAAKQFLDYGIEKLFCYNKFEAIESERIWGLVACKTCGYASTEEYTGSFLGYLNYIIKHYEKRQ